MKTIIGVVGAGTMGAGIAQVAAQAGHSVVLTDTNPEQLQRAEQQIVKSLDKLVDKGKITLEQAEIMKSSLSYSTQLSDHSAASLVIEAIIEKLEIKHQLFEQLEQTVGPNCILAHSCHSLKSFQVWQLHLNIPSKLKRSSRVGTKLL
jgi:3-hydroxybutyryl-CoA dehydrogenase